MISLPPSTTALNQHSLQAIEYWLVELGAVRSEEDPCIWDWRMPTWSAQINVDIGSIRIIWEKNGDQQQCSFPYGLSREDIQSAFFQGPYEKNS